MNMCHQIQAKSQEDVKNDFKDKFKQLDEFGIWLYNTGKFPIGITFQ